VFHLQLVLERWRGGALSVGKHQFKPERGIACAYLSVARRSFSGNSDRRCDIHRGQFIYGSGSIFGVIVPLSGPAGLPSGVELSGTNVLAETTFTPPASSNFVVNDYQTPLSVTLQPGSYGLVFGTGEFGATGTASLTNNTSFLGLQSYFDWYPPQGGWVQGTFPSSRFVIEGTVVPEPVSMGLLTVGLVGFLGRRPVRRCGKTATRASQLQNTVTWDSPV
jgi:hypothetical protein